MLVIAGSALRGEAAAGRDWQATLHARPQIGLAECENVPCLYVRETADGHEARCSTIVDDLLVTEAGLRRDLTDELHTELSRAFGGKPVTIEFEPDCSPATRLWDRGRGVVTMRMHSKIEEFVIGNAPEIANEQQRSQLQLLSGTKLDEALKALKLPPKEERKQKLSKSRSGRSITGGIRWFEVPPP